MNQETEVKILEVDKEKIIESLKENNAEFIKNVFQKNFVYTNSHTTFNKILVRVRDEDADVFITVKGPGEIKDNVKIREEIEFNVKDEAKIKRMLELLGFEKTKYYEYKREYYKLEGCTVEIIEAFKVPIFLELEGTKEQIVNAANKLGYGEKDFFNGKIYDKYDAYTDNLRFEDE